MKDEQRIDQMKEGAKFLRELPDTLTADDRARLANVAHGMERFADYVLDRDAGPNRDAATEIRRLSGELILANKVAKEIDVDFMRYRDKTKAVRHDNSALRDKIKGLEDELSKARAAALPKPTDQIPEAAPASSEG